ncbi:hypothetical protein ACVWW1_000787 [Bradyrhizobium sp. JR3.5]
MITITGTMVSMGARAIHEKRGRHGQYDALPEHLKQQYRDEAAACLEYALAVAPVALGAAIQTTGTK